MSLTHYQKNYIKKYIREQTVEDISLKLNLNRDEILNYLEKKWSKDKLQVFLKQTATHQTLTLKRFGIKAWIKNHWINLLILTLLIVATFVNALNNAFLSDDLAEIVQNPRIGEFSYIFTHPFGFIRLILNWAAYHIGGLNTAIFRLINFSFHLGSVYLLYTMLNLLYNKRVALFAAAIFAIHPAIAEAVVWISGGTYPQYTFFFLLSLLLYILAKNSKRLLLLSIIFYTFSFMSHPQMPIALFLIFSLFELCFGNLKKNWAKTIPYFLIATTYLFITLGALPERTTTLRSVHYQERGIDNPFVLIPVAISSYLQLIIWPNILTLYHSELAFGPVEFLIRSLITILAVAFVIYGFWKNKSWFFWGSFTLISLAPTLTPFRLNWIVAERYLYLPSVGIFTLIALGLNKLTSFKNLRFAIFPAVTVAIILLSVRTIVRNIDWKNEDNLWIATGKTSPSSPNTHNNLGDVYGRRGDKEGALREFQTAIALKPNYADAYHNLANTYRELNQIDKALENYQKAIEFNPNLWQSYQNIASIYFVNKQYDLSIQFIEKAISINPKNINLVNNLGIAYIAKGDKEKAKEIFTRVLNIDPQNQLARQGLIEASK